MPSAASLLMPRARERDAPERCAHCRRTPLVGELVHVYAAAAGERLVCELCRPRRREPPARSELMLAPGRERSVRVRRR